MKYIGKSYLNVTSTIQINRARLQIHMRILRIADVPNNRTGGMSRAMYGTGDFLDNNGHQVDYLFSEHFRSQVPAQLRRFTTPFKVAALLRRLRRKNQYDVMEIHEPLAAVACLQRRYQKGMPPVVIFSHGLEERGRTAELAYRKQKGLPISIKQRYSPLSVVLQAMYGVRHCSQVICLNSADYNHLIQSGVSKEHVTQLHNGIEDHLLLAGKQEDPHRSGLLFVGSWLVRKGILDLVPAVTEVLRRHPELRFTVAGSGIDAETVTRDFAPEVQGQITVIPKFSGNATSIKLYKKHSILVLPSYFEGQPLVMIEAAAFGMVIVATKIGGIADFIQDEQNGILVQVGNPHDLETKIESVITDESYARMLGAAARATAHNHTWTQSARVTLQAYEKAIEIAKSEE